VEISPYQLYGNDALFVSGTSPAPVVRLRGRSAPGRVAQGKPMRQHILLSFGNVSVRLYLCFLSAQPSFPFHSSEIVTVVDSLVLSPTGLDRSLGSIKCMTLC
jgi:hypothetical protein